MATKKEKATAWVEESDRWDGMSLQELIDASEPVEAKFVDRRPRKAISLRVDEELIAAGKRAAEEVGIGYQTLFRMWLIEGLRRYRERKLSERPSKKTRSAA